MRKSICISLLMLISLPVLAADATEKAIFQAVLSLKAKTAPPKSHYLASSSTTEGRGSAVVPPLDDPAQKARVLEMSRDFSYKDMSGVAMDAAVPEGFSLADVSPFRAEGGFDWTKLAAAHEGANGVVELSRPGFTQEGSEALVRAITTLAGNQTTTEIFHIQRQSDGSWVARLVPAVPPSKEPTTGTPKPPAPAAPVAAPPKKQ